MPTVGNKHYPYTPKGIARAKAAAMATGKPMETRPKKAKKGEK